MLTKTPHSQKRLLFGGVFSLLVLVWAAWSLDWSEVWQALRTAHYGWVAIAIGLNFVAFFTRTLRWGLLLQPASPHFSAQFKALIIGQAANYISPARIGDLLRAYILGQATGISKTQALATVAVEKLWDLLMLMIFTIIVGWFFPLPIWLLQPARGMIILTILATIGFILILWQQTQALTWIDQLSLHLLPRFHERILHFSHNVFAGLAGIRSGSLVWQIGFWSLLTWLAGGLLNYAVLWAFDLSHSLTAAFLLLVVLQVGVALPSLPGRIGVFQGICVVVLALFGISYNLAFSYGVLLHLIVFLPPIILSALLSFRLNLLPNASLLND